MSILRSRFSERSHRRHPDGALGRAGERRFKEKVNLMHIDSSKRPYLLARMALATLMLGATACSADFEDPALDEEVSLQAEALGEAACATLPATVTYSGGIPSTWTSPQTYDTQGCYKTQIIDINHYSSQYLGDGDKDGGTYVSWADATPRNQADCEELWLRVDLYSRNGTSGPFTFEQTKRARGWWLGGPVISGCYGPSLSFVEGDLVANRSYRFVVSSRTGAGSSAPTRKFGIVTLRPQIIK